MRGLFVTGTDTGCGKTEISLGLMQWWQARGLRVAGMKPVASGARESGAGLRNGDALRIQAQASGEPDYDLVNPCAFAAPIAPHLAAQEAGRPISLEPILTAYRQLTDAAERVVVEGVGGWRVPLGPGLELPDLARALRLPVVLVVGLRLGCLNHALLSAEAIQKCGLPLYGWVGNQIEPRMRELAGNLGTLQEALGAPCLGWVPYLPRPDAARVAARLQLPD